MVISRTKLVSLVLAGVCVAGVVVAATLLMTRQSATANSDETAAITTSKTDRQTGPSGLPVPRYVSLKTDRVNVRRGPSTEHQVIWVFAKQGLPVEIIAESDLWRRVRDSDGEEGWVYHTLLAGRRTGLVAPWSKGENVSLRDGPKKSAQTVAIVQTGVIGEVLRCTGKWCEFSANGYNGWLKQDMLWGVYPDEKIE